jgi:hypothetical protein
VVLLLRTLKKGANVGLALPHPSCQELRAVDNLTRQSSAASELMGKICVKRLEKSGQSIGGEAEGGEELLGRDVGGK